MNMVLLGNYILFKSFLKEAIFSALGFPETTVFQHIFLRLVPRNKARELSQAARETVAHRFCSDSFPI